MKGTSGGRLLCIGDVHGCARELSRLLDALGLTQDDRVVFLGDYVDRGEASAAAIQCLLEVRKGCREAVFLRGNHEEMMLDFLGLDGAHGDIFLRAGGAATLRSYGMDPASGIPSPSEARRRLPEDHVAFLAQSLVFSHVEEPWAFVHAGVRPGVALSAQAREDLLWIREDFLSGEHGLPQTIVYGHTPRRDVEFSRARRIGLDTGCVYGGRLSALDLTQGRLHQIRRGSLDVTVRSVSEDIGRTLA